MSEIKVVPCPIHKPNFEVSINGRHEWCGTEADAQARAAELRPPTGEHHPDCHASTGCMAHGCSCDRDFVPEPPNPDRTEQAAPPRPLHGLSNLPPEQMTAHAPAAIEQARPQTQEVCETFVPTRYVNSDDSPCVTCGKYRSEHHAAAAEPAPERTPPQPDWKKTYWTVRAASRLASVDPDASDWTTQVQEILKSVHDDFCPAVPEPAAQPYHQGIRKCLEIIERVRNRFLVPWSSMMDYAVNEIKQELARQAEPAPTPSRALELTNNHGLFEFRGVDCPYCHKPIALWAERFKGSATRIMHVRHIATDSAKCEVEANGKD